MADIDLQGETLPVSPTGDLRLVEGVEAAVQSLRRRLPASPGSLTHRPDYGAGLEAAVELPATPAQLVRIANRCRAACLNDARVLDAEVLASADEVEVRVVFDTDADANVFTVPLG